MTVVELTPWEYKHCVDVANTRMSVSIAKGLKDHHHETRDYNSRLLEDIRGLCGELAVAKHLNKFWAPSVNTFHDVPDILPNIEVRTTKHENGRLMVRDNDSDDRFYFLVIGNNPPRMDVRGWIKGCDAKKPEWIDNPHGHREAWFVPQSALNPMKED